MTEITVPNDKIIVVIDAGCRVCAGGARWIAKRDHADRFRIVPMQSHLGQRLFADHGIDPQDPASWLYLENGAPMSGLDAWSRVGQVLGGTARALSLIMVVPKPLRDRLYAFVVRNRIRFFGTADLCHMPHPEVARRLLQ